MRVFKPSGFEFMGDIAQGIGAFFQSKQMLEEQEFIKKQRELETKMNQQKLKLNEMAMSEAEEARKERERLKPFTLFEEFKARGYDDEEAATMTEQSYPGSLGSLFVKAPAKLPAEQGTARRYETTGPRQQSYADDMGSPFLTPGGRPKAGQITGGFTDVPVAGGTLESIFQAPSAKITEPGKPERMPEPKEGYEYFTAPDGQTYVVPINRQQQIGEMQFAALKNEYNNMASKLNRENYQTAVEVAGSLVIAGKSDKEISDAIQPYLAKGGTVSVPNLIANVRGVVAAKDVQDEKDFKRWTAQALFGQTLDLQKMGVAQGYNVQNAYLGADLDMTTAGVKYRMENGGMLIRLPSDKSNAIAWSDSQNPLNFGAYPEYTNALDRNGIKWHKGRGLPGEGGKETVPMLVIDGDPIEATRVLLAETKGIQNWYGNGRDNGASERLGIHNNRDFANASPEAQNEYMDEVFRRENGATESLFAHYIPPKPGKREVEGIEITDAQVQSYVNAFFETERKLNAAKATFDSFSKMTPEQQNATHRELYWGGKTRAITPEAYLISLQAATDDAQLDYDTAADEINRYGLTDFIEKFRGMGPLNVGSGATLEDKINARLNGG